MTVRETNQEDVTEDFSDQISDEALDAPAGNRLSLMTQTCVRAPQPSDA